MRGIRTTVIVAGFLCLPATPAHSGSPAPHWGLEVSGSAARLSSDAAGHAGQPPVDFRADFGGGVTLRWELDGQWSLTSGARYLRIDQRVQATLTVPDSTGAHAIGSTDEKTRWHWLAVPLEARYDPPGFGRLSFDAGAELRYLLVARSRAEVRLLPAALSGPGIAAAPQAQILESVPRGEWYDDTASYRRFDVALMAGIGMRFGLGDHEGLLRIGFSNGLPDLDRGGRAIRRSQVGEVSLGLDW